MKIFNAIGLMSGTSCDGIDLSYIRSNGKNYIEYLGNFEIKYDNKFKDKLRHLLTQNPSLYEIKSLENQLTSLHADCVNQFLETNKIDYKEVDFIGFHGQTILHKPNEKITWQIGNPYLLENLTKIRVVPDFRLPDVAAGGQGAPLAPIYHFYLTKDKSEPTLILNIGGIANITYFSSPDENSLQAFDFCFGNALSDDLVKKHKNLDFDKNGEIAKQGKVDFVVANEILQNQIFHLEPVKSFDRFDFVEVTQGINNLELADALATLAYIFAKALKINIEKFLPHMPRQIIICGGGRKNQAILSELKEQLPNCQIKIAEDSKLNGDFIEAEAFAFLAIRKELGLPISFKKTTGVV